MIDPKLAAHFMAVGKGIAASAVLGLGLFVFACGSSESGASSSSGDGGAREAGRSSSSSSSSSGGSDGSSDDANGGSLRTLATCTTDIGADVPAFYRTYFKCVTIRTTADGVAITTESLPPHKTNYYGASDPNYEPFDTSRGADYHPNPNLLSKKGITITVPNVPVAKEGVIINAALVDGVARSSTEEYPLGPAGVALDSVALFNPLAAPGDDIEKEKYTFDAYDAHPAPDGTYHYHLASRGPREVIAAIGQTVEVYGIMCDGVPVLGCTELDGSVVDTDLDSQGGHVGDVKDGQGTVHFAGRYHVHMCATGRKYTPEIQFYKACGR